MNDVRGDLTELLHRLRGTCGDRADDVLALFAIQQGDAPIGSARRALIDGLLTRAGAYGGDASQAIVDYFQKRPLPSAVVQEAAQAMREFTTSARTSGGSPNAGRAFIAPSSAGSSRASSRSGTGRTSSLLAVRSQKPH
jgi:hypothetical protein